MFVVLILELNKRFLMVEYQIRFSAKCQESLTFNFRFYPNLGSKTVGKQHTF